MTRRTIVAAGAGLSSVGLSSCAGAVAKAFAVKGQGRSASDIATDEDVWADVARAYRLGGRYIILNGGGNNPHPAAVVDPLNRYDQLTSTAPRPHNYVFQGRIDTHRRRLVKLFGCEPNELAITRNTTEGLNIVGWQVFVAAIDKIASRSARPTSFGR